MTSSPLRHRIVSLPRRRPRATAYAAAALVAALALTTGYLWGSRGRAGESVTTSPGASVLGSGSADGRLAASPARASSGSSSGSSGSSGSSPGSVGSASADPAEADGAITVTGTGTAGGTPDALDLSMGVDVTASSVSDALDEANTAASRVQASLRQHGVAAADLATSGLSVQAQYGSSTSSITGYQVSESLTATLRDLASAGDALTAAARAGGNATRIDAVTLDLADTGPLMTAARTAAFTQAQDKARQYARAAGVRLGSVTSISESTSSSGVTTPVAAAEGSASAVPVAAGTQSVQVSVTASFAIVPSAIGD